MPDPFDAWDEHAFRLWAALDRSAKLRGQIVGMIDHQHEIDALSYMFAAIDDARDEVDKVTVWELYTVPGLMVGKSWAREMMLRYAKLAGMKTATAGDTGAVMMWWDEDREIQFENIEDRDFWGIDLGRDVSTFELKPEPVPTLPTPKRERDPFHTHPRSPRDTMRARRGR